MYLSEEQLVQFYIDMILTQALICGIAYPSRASVFTPCVWWGPCCSSFMHGVDVLFVFVLCLVCQQLTVSLNCPFLIASSVFSNVCLDRCIMYQITDRLCPLQIQHKISPLNYFAFKYFSVGVLDEGYSRNASCALNLISTFL